MNLLRHQVFPLHSIDPFASWGMKPHLSASKGLDLSLEGINVDGMSSEYIGAYGKNKIGSQVLDYSRIYGRRTPQKAPQTLRSDISMNFVNLRAVVLSTGYGLSRGIRKCIVCN